MLCYRSGRLWETSAWILKATSAHSISINIRCTTLQFSPSAPRARDLSHAMVTGMFALWILVQRLNKYNVWASVRPLNLCTIFYSYIFKMLLGRDDLVGRVFDYIERDFEGSSVVAKGRGASAALLQSKTAIGHPPSADAFKVVPPLVLAGRAGAGKSSVVAYCARLACERSDWKVVFHLSGASAGSTSLYRVISRFAPLQLIN